MRLIDAPKDINDINFLSMAELLDQSNAGLVTVSIGDYHLMMCSNAAYEVINEAYDNWQWAVMRMRQVSRNDSGLHISKRMQERKRMVHLL